MRLHAALLALSLLAVPGRAALADEGMWTFDNFPKAAVKEKHGVEITDAWLKHVRLASVRLAGGCSGSFVSAGGLVMTNYHCAVGCVKDASTKDKDYQVDGFYAKSEDKEIACPEIEVNQLLDIADVTSRVKGATKDLEGAAFIKAQRAEMGLIEKSCSEENTYRCDVVPLYHGGLYHLYKYRTYRDVKLVFVPERDSAFFGGDPDNFNFPRYNLDLAFLRVYEGGKPAATGDHFTWSASGAKEGEAIFTPGNPGGTDRLLTVAQLEYARDVQYPNALLRLSELRGILEQFGKIGAEEKRVSQDQLLLIENAIKVQRGEFEAILDRKLFDAKSKAERELRDRIAADPETQGKYGTAWDAIAKAQERKRDLRKTLAFMERGSGFTSDLYSFARILVRGAAERPKPNGERLREYRDSALPSIEQRLFSTAPISRELQEVQLEFSLSKLREEMGADDPFVKKVLGRESPESLARSLLAGTKLDDVALRKKMWEEGAKAVDASDDSMIRLARLVDADGRAVRKTYEEEVDAPERMGSELVAQALFAEKGTSTYPDATFTPRLAYGAVRGWVENGRTIPPFTTIGGLFDRATGKEPYALPKSWIDGKGKLKMDTPMNFSNDLDIVGGNSGSPVINKDGEVVGLLFDGNIHSLGGNFWFDDKLNRAVAVHSSLILEALQEIYDADRLVKELKPGR
jgi:hypothetical protein